MRAGVTKRTWSRPKRSGVIVKYTRYVVSYRDPRTGTRVQLFFARHMDALEKRNDIITQCATGTLPSGRTDVTVADQIHWRGAVPPGRGARGARPWGIRARRG